MLRGSEVEQKTDIIVASSISTARCLTKDHEGLIPAPEQPEFYLVVDCPSLHIVSGDNIGPRRQSDTDVSLKVSCISSSWYKITSTDRLSLASQQSTMPSAPSVSKSSPEPDRLHPIFHHQDIAHLESRLVPVNCHGLFGRIVHCQRWCRLRLIPPFEEEAYRPLP